MFFNRHLKWIIFGLLLAFSQAGAQEVLHHPDPSQSLEARTSWAIEKASDKSMQDGVWIGYSITRQMGKRSFMGTFGNPALRKLPSLHQLIYGKPAPYPTDWDEDRDDKTSLKDAAKRELNRLKGKKEEPEPKVDKEIALLFRYDPVEDEENRIQKLAISNLSLRHHLKGLPLIWIGKSGNAESFALLKRMYDTEGSTTIKEKYLHAISLHGEESGAYEFMTSVVEKEDHLSLRKTALFWMSQHKHPGTVEYLLKIVRADEPYELREKAIFGLSQMDNTEGLNAIIDLSRNLDNRKLRKKAIFWLGQNAKDRAVGTLESIVRNGDDLELQEKAVFAISQLPDGKGIPRLIEIAKSDAHPKIRKKAIFWLGQSDDPRALESLIDLAQNNR